MLEHESAQSFLQLQQPSRTSSKYLISSPTTEHNTSRVGSLAPTAIMNGDANNHNPTTWDASTVLNWISGLIPQINSRIEDDKGKTPSSTTLIITILDLVRSQPQLCVEGYGELLDKVVAKFTKKRLVPTAVLESVEVNPIFTEYDEIPADFPDTLEEDNTESELSFDLEIHNPTLNEIHGFAPELAYKRLLNEFREIRRNNRLGQPVIGNNGEISTAHINPEEEEDLMPENDEDDNLSDASSTFLRELEEENLQPQPKTVTIDYDQIIQDEISQLRQKWIKKKLPKCQSKVRKLWSSYFGPIERFKAAEIKESTARHLNARLNKLKATIAETVMGMKEKGVRKQCSSLEQTVFDHERILFERDMLQQSLPPSLPEIQTRKRSLSATTPIDDGDQSDPDAISVGSESEVEFDAYTIPQLKKGDFIMPDADTLDQPPAILPVIIETDEEFLKDSNPIPTRSPIYITINGVSPSNDTATTDAELMDRLTPITNEEPEADISGSEGYLRPNSGAEDKPGNQYNQENESGLADATTEDIDFIEEDYEVLLSQTPAGRKRRRTFQQSQESKRHQSDAIKRAKEDEDRTLQNSNRFQRPGHIPVNPGKQDDQEYVYIHEETCKKLKTHQIEGIQFLWREILLEHDESHATGCLLSHTMGLGKTMQIITLLVTIAEASQSGGPTLSLIPPSLRQTRTMILCPPGLISNWEAEVRKWIPADAKGILGRVAALESLATSIESLELWAANGGVLIVGYSLFGMIVGQVSRDATPFKSKQLLLNTATIVIADEAHNIKNDDTGIRQAVNQISTRRRIAMTGSPLSNNIKEYWSMIDWVSPGYLGPSKEFNMMFEVPIKDGSFLESSSIEVRAARTALETLERVLTPKVHRRDATVLKDTLPPKREFILKLSLTNPQAELYARFVELLKTHGTGKFKRGNVFQYGKKLIYISNHPAIFSRHEFSKEDTKYRSKALEDSPSGDLALVKPCEMQQLAIEYNDEDINASFKTVCFLKIVEAAIKEGDKTLLFTQSLRTVDYLADQLAANGIGHDKLVGSVDVKKRGEMLASFNDETGPSSKSVLLISTKTGNAGFNIHGANRVVIFDFDWNPTYEEQAIGRAYRLGQRKSVFVYRFVSDGTFETVLLNQTARKTQLSVQVVGGKQTQNVVSKAGQKYIAPPQISVAPASTLLDAFWRGKDVVLDRLLDENANRPSPFITELIDAEAYRTERQVEPLDEEQQRNIDDWVARCQRGDWTERRGANALTHATNIQMQLIEESRSRVNTAVSYDTEVTPFTALSGSSPVFALLNPAIQAYGSSNNYRLDSAPPGLERRAQNGPTDGIAESSIHEQEMEEEEMRVDSTDTGSVSGGEERQDVRNLAQFNIAPDIESHTARPAHVTSRLGSSTATEIPRDVEIIDLTGDDVPAPPQPRMQKEGLWVTMATIQQNPQLEPRQTLEPAQRAARILQQQDARLQHFLERDAQQHNIGTNGSQMQYGNWGRVPSQGLSLNNMAFKIGASHRAVPYQGHLAGLAQGNRNDNSLNRPMAPLAPHGNAQNYYGQGQQNTARLQSTPPEIATHQHQSIIRSKETASRPHSNSRTQSYAPMSTSGTPQLLEPPRRRHRNASQSTSTPHATAEATQQHQLRTALSNNGNLEFFLHQNRGTQANGSASTLRTAAEAVKQDGHTYQLLSTHHNNRDLQVLEQQNNSSEAERSAQGNIATQIQGYKDQARGILERINPQE